MIITQLKHHFAVFGILKFHVVEINVNFLNLTQLTIFADSPEGQNALYHSICTALGFHELNLTFGQHLALHFCRESISCLLSIFWT